MACRLRDSTARAALDCHPFLGWFGSTSPSWSSTSSAAPEARSSQEGGTKPTSRTLALERMAWMLSASLPLLIARKMIRATSGLAFRDHFHAVCPTGPVCCVPQFDRTAEAQSACRQRKGRSFAGRPLHCRGLHTHQRAETFPDVVVVEGGERVGQIRADGPQEEVGSRNATIQQEEPRTM